MTLDQLPVPFVPASSSVECEWIICISWVAGGIKWDKHGTCPAQSGHLSSSRFPTTVVPFWTLSLPGILSLSPVWRQALWGLACAWKRWCSPAGFDRQACAEPDRCRSRVNVNTNVSRMGDKQCGGGLARGLSGLPSRACEGNGECEKWEKDK